jgi:hypothetical protein
MLAFAACASCGSQPVSRVSSGVRLNEVSSTNHTVRDDAGATGDWIELVNLGEFPVNLGGYYLSDDVDTRFIHVLSDAVSVQGSGYLLLWADDKPEAGPLHLGFKLSADGEGVWFSNPQGYLVDSVEFGRAPSASSSANDAALGRFPNASGQFQWCGSPTPDESNGDECTNPVR